MRPPAIVTTDRNLTLRRTGIAPKLLHTNKKALLGYGSIGSSRIRTSAMDSRRSDGVSTLESKPLKAFNLSIPPLRPP
jgi:hypothetical protein